MRNFIDTFFKGDKVIWLLFCTFIVLSALIMYSASSFLAHRSSSYYGPVWSHCNFLFIGFVVAFVVHHIPFRIINKLVPLIYLVSFVLVLLAAFGGVSVNGASRWLSLGPINIQPSELMKIAIILMVSYVWTGRADKGADSSFWWCALICVVPAFIIMLDNMSTFLLIMVVFACMTLYAGVSWKIIWKVGGSALAVLVLLVGIALLTPREQESNSGVASIENAEKKEPSKSLFSRGATWTKRVHKFFDEGRPHDENYKLEGDTYQEDRAKIAVASGKWFGVGIGNSVQRDLLPLAFADFIFSIIVEEWGFFALLIPMLYLIFLYRVGIMVQNYCSSYNYALVSLGLSTMIVVQAFVNIFISVGLFPVSGQSLPLFSRGGTSIVITCICFGLILNISREVMEQRDKQRDKERKEVKKRELKKIES